LWCKEQHAEHRSRFRHTSSNESGVIECFFLLQETKAPPWDDFALSNENVYQWPEEGNLCDFANRVEPPEVVTGQGEEEAETDNANDGRIEDGGDSGPAPLQNGFEPDETFTGTKQRAGRSGSILEGAVNGPAKLSEAAAMLRAQVEEQKEDDEEAKEEEKDEADAEASRVLPRIQLNADGTEAAVDQTEILPTGDFVDMRRTKFAWAMAFPTVFRPRQLTDGSYMVDGDCTGWDGPRDRTPQFHEWAKHLMWRSDGMPAKHPTLGLVLNNDIQRRQLHSQGLVALHLDNSMDATSTA
jgi:hypothetical protein